MRATLCWLLAAFLCLMFALYPDLTLLIPSSSALLFLHTISHATCHPGNVMFRRFVEDYKTLYTTASKPQKSAVADQVVQLWRNRSPPGKFLARTDPSMGDDSPWRDVGDRQARQKVAQSLREKTEPFVGLLLLAGPAVAVSAAVAPECKKRARQAETAVISSATSTNTTANKLCYENQLPHQDQACRMLAGLTSWHLQPPALLANQQQAALLNLQPPAARWYLQPGPTYIPPAVSTPRSFQEEPVSTPPSSSFKEKYDQWLQETGLSGDVVEPIPISDGSESSSSAEET